MEAGGSSGCKTTFARRYSSLDGGGQFSLPVPWKAAPHWGISICLAHSRKAWCAGTPLLLLFGMSCEKKGPSKEFLLLAQEVNATQTSDTYSHLTPTVVLFLNRHPALLFPSMQYGSQECGC